MPASMAASTTALVWSASIVMPKLLHPSPTADTSSEPRRRVSMRSTLDRPVRRPRRSCRVDDVIGTVLDVGEREQQQAKAGCGEPGVAVVVGVEAVGVPALAHHLDHDASVA